MSRFMRLLLYEWLVRFVGINDAKNLRTHETLSQGSGKRTCPNTLQWNKQKSNTNLHHIKFGSDRFYFSRTCRSG